MHVLLKASFHRAKVLVSDDKSSTLVSTLLDLTINAVQQVSEIQEKV